MQGAAGIGKITIMVMRRLGGAMVVNVLVVLVGNVGSRHRLRARARRRHNPRELGDHEQGDQQTSEERYRA